MFVGLVLCVCVREIGWYIYIEARAEDRRIRMSCPCRSELIEWDRSVNVMSFDAVCSRSQGNEKCRWSTAGCCSFFFGKIEKYSSYLTTPSSHTDTSSTLSSPSTSSDQHSPHTPLDPAASPVRKPQQHLRIHGHGASRSRRLYLPARTLHARSRPPGALSPNPRCSVSASRPWAYMSHAKLGLCSGVLSPYPIYS